MALGLGALESDPIVVAARPVLEEGAQALGETFFLVAARAGCLVVLDKAEGTGFLRHMVRNLVGSLIEVGSGRRRADALAAVLAARDRQRAGPTAPAHALTLVRVDYESDSPGRSAG